MKSVFLILSFLIGTYHNALSDIPSLDFDPASHQQNNSTMSLSDMNDEILDFLAKNLLLDKADIIVRECSDLVGEAKNGEMAKAKLENVREFLRSQSILSRDKLEKTFNNLEKLIEENPSALEKTPLGERILIQTNRNQSIEVSFIINA